MWAHRSGQEVAGEIHKSRIPILLSAAGFCNCFMCGNCFGTVELQYILDKAFIGYGYGDLCEIYSSRKLE